MRLVDRHIYLNWEELTHFGIPQATLKSGVDRNRKGATSYINQKLDGRNYIELISIPEDTRIAHNIPTEEELLQEIQTAKLKDLYRVDEKCFDIYFNSPEKENAQDLSELAAWFMLCAPMKLRKAKDYGYSSVDGFYQDVINLTISSQLKGSVTNLRIFKNKLKPFKAYFKDYPTHFRSDHPDYFLTSHQIHPQYESALRSLISKKHGMKNAARLESKSANDKQAEEMQALILSAYSNPMKLNFEQVWAGYMHEAAKMMRLHEETNGSEGWDKRCEISKQTMKNWLYKPEIRQMWYPKRHGKKPAADLFKVVTKRKVASFANAKWVIDGTPIPMYFSHNGHNYNRLNAFIVLDEYSWAVIGYALDFSENSENVIKALRKACKLTNCMPYEIQSDNASAITGDRGRKAIEAISKK
ncbi:MAG: transposase family protein, partial [Bacteroidota bacterium]